MGLFDRLKSAISSQNPAQPPLSKDHCQDQTFAPRFQEKKINVFVSSTFRDMIVERDELTLKIFPALRKECENRGISWSDVDLRWGIPPEKSEQGETSSICLQYIDKCRPYFIGMLGERYGWVDPDAPKKVKDDFPWVEKEAGKSITELEILHGVLNNPKMEDHAFFYFRDKGYLESMSFKAKVPESERAEYIETEEEPKRKLTDLKNRIRASGFPVRENYQDPVMFGELVRKDLMDIINSLAPSPEEIKEEENTDVYLDRELATHETFVASRFGVYIRRKEYFDRLDTYTQMGGQPLAVTGESGCGKSALLAHWVFLYQNKHPEDLVLFHFIGASSASSDWAMMLRRLMGELKRECGIQIEIPTKEEEISPAFMNFLAMAGKKKSVVLIIDAVNQLDDQGGALDLTWLPPKIPDGVRIIVSTLPGKSLAALRKRDSPEMEVRPLTQDEQKRLIVCYFRQFNKEPSKEMISELIRSEQCRNPLYLRVVLEEIRIHGVYECLADQVRDLLTARTIPALYGEILARYEHDYESEYTCLVRDTMSLIWASRRGLSINELLAILGRDNKPLPDAILAPLFLAADKGLIEKGGYITFFHEYIRQAVETKYLFDPALIRQAHFRLASYFGKINEGSRQAEELPWQLEKAGEWKSLVKLLTDESFLIRMFINHSIDLKKYWVNIENKSPYRMINEYQKLFDTNKEMSPEILNILGILFKDTGHLNEAEKLFETLISRSHENPYHLKASLGNKAIILKIHGNLDEALSLLQEQERICHRLRDKESLQICYGNQALVQIDQGNLEIAMELLKEQEQICRELRNNMCLQTSLGNQALILKNQGDLKEAMRLLKEKEQICRNLGNVDCLQRSLGNQALILKNQNDLKNAMELLKEQERICLELGNLSDLQSSLGNQALILLERKQFDEAMRLLKEKERICRDLGNMLGLANSLTNQATIYLERKNFIKAMAIFKNQEEICRKIMNIEGLTISLANQAVIHLHNRDRIAASNLIHEAYQLSSDNKYHVLAKRFKLFKEQNQL